MAERNAALKCMLNMLPTLMLNSWRDQMYVGIGPLMFGNIFSRNKCSLLSSRHLCCWGSSPLTDRKYQLDRQLDEITTVPFVIIREIHFFMSKVFPWPTGSTFLDSLRNLHPTLGPFPTHPPNKSVQQSTNSTPYSERPRNRHVFFWFLFQYMFFFMMCHDSKCFMWTTR